MQSVRSRSASSSASGSPTPRAMPKARSASARTGEVVRRAENRRSAKHEQPRSRNVLALPELAEELVGELPTTLNRVVAFSRRRPTSAAASTMPSGRSPLPLRGTWPPPPRGAAAPRRLRRRSPSSRRGAGCAGLGSARYSPRVRSRARAARSRALAHAAKPRATRAAVARTIRPPAPGSRCARGLDIAGKRGSALSAAA